jgi:hypothetical protein
VGKLSGRASEPLDFTAAAAAAAAASTSPFY